MANIFITGGTGFMGQRLIRELLARDHRVTALARPGSQSKLPSGCIRVPGDPLDAASYSHLAAGADTWVHLVGTSKPSPWKEKQFRSVDLAGVREMCKVLPSSGVRHLIYVSVAQPAPAMQSYIRVRQECEQLIATTGVPATILRPWYVLGPGRRWPLVLLPIYKLAELLGSEAATRLGLVTLDQMLNALVWSAEHPGSRILDVPAIRNGPRLDG